MPLSLNGTSGLSGVDGSAGTPALQGSDTNTGIHFGTDEINLDTGGSTRATVDSSGRLLVGTSTEGVSGGDQLTIAASGNSGMTIRAGTSDRSSIYMSDGTSGSAEYRGYIEYDHGSDYMRFGSAAVERMRIDSLGLTTIFADTGASGTGPLTVSTAYTGQNNSRRIIIGKHSATNTSDGTRCFMVYDDGDVVNTDNSYGAISDIKLKENIVDASSQWDDLKAIQVRNYNFKEETGHRTHTQIGVIAQEIELVSPGLVSESPDVDDEGNDLSTTTKSVNYSVLYMKAVKALQEAMTRIEQLETRVAQLEGGAS